MTSIMDTKTMEPEQWGWFIDLESNEKIIIKNKEVDKNYLLRKETLRREIEAKEVLETKEKVGNINLENQKKEKSEMILYLKKRYKLCIYNLILNLVCSVSIVFIIKFMIIL
jgi:hypothetical protein